MMTACIYGGRQNAFCAPSVTQTAAEGIGVYANLPCPFNNGLALTVVFKNMINPRIIALLGNRRPAAILWRIRAIVINAIQRASFRAFAYIGKEVSKALAPTLTDNDTASSVVGVLWAVGVVTSGLHLLISRA